jgi:germination protein M
VVGRIASRAHVPFVLMCVLAMLVAATTACNTISSGEDSSAPDGSESVEDPVERFSFEVWYLTGETLYRATRSDVRTPSVGRAALEALLRGPTSEETAAGVNTAIPAGTDLLGLDIDDGTATVDLTSDYASRGGALSIRMRLAQVVYTITQFPTVSSVAFRLDGDPAIAFSSAGIEVGNPLGRGDFEDLLPPIMVDAPSPGAEVTSPVTVTGSANVFEATVSIRILNADGEEIASAFTTATCGTGCRGDYTADVEFEVAGRQSGTIEVFEQSMEDGSDLFTVSIPVTLIP